MDVWDKNATFLFHNNVVKPRCNVTLFGRQIIYPSEFPSRQKTASEDLWEVMQERVHL